MTDLNLKLNSFQQAYSKIDFENANEDTLKRAKELQRMAEDYRDKLEGVFFGLFSLSVSCIRGLKLWVRSAEVISKSCNPKTDEW